MKKTYTGPVTGKVYDLANGDVIDIEAEGIGMTGDKKSPNAEINGSTTYRRIFVKRRTPDDILNHKPIANGVDLAERLYLIAQWYDNMMKIHGDFYMDIDIRIVPVDETATETELARRDDAPVS